jgi:hypothetical protein
LIEIQALSLVGESLWKRGDSKSRPKISPPPLRVWLKHSKVFLPISSRSGEMSECSDPSFPGTGTYGRQGDELEREFYLDHCVDGIGEGIPSESE